MERYTSDDQILNLLIDSEVLLNRVLSMYNIHPRGLDRWHAAYRTIREYRDKRNAARDARLSIIPDYMDSQKRITLLQAMHDCWELGGSLHKIDTENPAIIKDKLRTLLTGPIGRTKDVGFAQGRDVLFELTLLSEFKASGLDAQLVDPNPDIRISVENRIYDVECKRLTGYTHQVFKRNLHNASKQITSNLPEAHRGVLAISVTDYITQGSGIIYGTTESDVDKTLNDLLEAFVREHESIWSNPSVVDPSIVGIIFHGSYIAGIETENIPYNITYPIIVVPSTSLPVQPVEEFIHDFRKIHNSANGGRNFTNDETLFITTDTRN